MDLSSWFANGNGTDIWFGTNDLFASDPLAQGTWNPVTRVSQLSWLWEGYVRGGPFRDLDQAHFTLTGLATPVPVPTALWLFGTGLAGVLAAAGRTS